MGSSEGKKISRLLAYSFENWLNTTIKALGLEERLAEKLTDRLYLIDPDVVPQFRITRRWRERNEKRLADIEKWRRYAEEITQEQKKLLEMADNDSKFDPGVYHQKHVTTRQMAIDNVRNKRFKAAKEPIACAGTTRTHRA
jgi:hypothetical protein